MCENILCSFIEIRRMCYFKDSSSGTSGATTSAVTHRLPLLVAATKSLELFKSLKLSESPAAASFCHDTSPGTLCRSFLQSYLPSSNHMMIIPITQYFWYLLCQSLDRLDDLNGLLMSRSHFFEQSRHDSCRRNCGIVDCAVNTGRDH